LKTKDLHLTNKNPGRLRLFRNEGRAFRKVTEEVVLHFALGVTQEVSADYDNDDDLDLIVGRPAGRIRLLRNDGGNLNRLAETAKQAMFFYR